MESKKEQQMSEKLPDIIHSSWEKHLLPLFNDNRMKLIKYEILTKVKFYPAKENMFNVFKMPLDKIKVVCIGQDPYAHGEAIGYAFAVDPKAQLPGSLRVIRNEIISSNTLRSSSMPIDTDAWKPLVHWRQQGIFLFNAALTVEPGKSNSHMDYWTWFAREVVRIISVNTTTKPVWLLWGSKAKSFRKDITMYEQWNNAYRGSEYNYILEADHPAAELYKASKYKFSGCNHFNICNEILLKKGQPIINW